MATATKKNAPKTETKPEATDAADAAVEESKEEKKQPRKSGKGRKAKVEFPVPEGGFKKPEVAGFNPDIHVRLDKEAFGGDDCLLLEHQVWLHKQAIADLEAKIAEMKKYNPALREGVQNILGNITKAAAAFKNLDLVAKEAGLDDKELDANKGDLSDSMKEHLKRLIDQM